MKVAIDISPTKTGHQIRGIGSYTKKLIEEFKNGTWPTEFEFFGNPTSPPPADIIHYPYFDLFFHTLPIKSKTSRVVTIHDVIPLIFPEHFPVGIRGRISFFLQKLALSNVDAVICDSKTSKNDISQKLSYLSEKIHVIYLAPGSKFIPVFDKKYLLKVAKRHKLPKDFILYVGDVNWNKNIANLLEAVKIAKVNLVMVGQALVDQNLPQTVAIDKKIKKLDIASRVIKTGYIDEEDLIAIYNLGQLTILPSYYEGFGLPVLESMACGTPVVCSKTASLSEIADSVATFCDPANPGDIAQKITKISNLPPKQKEELSQKSLQHASGFTWQKVAGQTFDIYNSLISVS